MTPPEISRSGSNSSWQVRVIPNLFPILGDDKKPELAGNYKYRKGNGFHEIIIETPVHDHHIADLSIDEMVLVLKTYNERIEAHREEKGLKYSLIFKNFGRRAGASLKHSHSQIISMPLIPKRILEEIATAKRYYRKTGQCFFCQMIREELDYHKRVIVNNAKFLAFVPFAARIPYETWIIPKDHYTNICGIDQTHQIELAKTLKSSLVKLNRVLDTPPFNYFIHTAPIGDDQIPYYHYHLVIMPATTRLGGFELGTGFYVNQSLAEEDAQRLKEAG